MAFFCDKDGHRIERLFYGKLVTEDTTKVYKTYASTAVHTLREIL